MRRHHHHHNHHRRLLSSFTAFTFLFFVLTQLGNGSEEREGREKGSGSSSLERVLTQKRLNGPGSSPPTCRSKCGKCSPCKPVHVPIQPGLSMPLEYYPEAWRCKCGNKLFMP
ncbi:EPIDERMAL PATTERNING FACTOR-like protein [Melia azedarach]|uniref:EPIDERMAL PATTERNING FACTOR-like protein n=1 Tax=Melia azedarach TaxID=155640 RepID=A0ACC1YGM2_MELAZ|nr:EPIDERMAL PATTERNING FACTOR-like protein [Melia azedarach]